MLERALRLSTPELVGRHFNNTETICFFSYVSHLIHHLSLTVLAIHPLRGGEVDDGYARGATPGRNPAEARVRLWHSAACRHGRQEDTSTVVGDRNVPRRLRRRRRARCARVLAV